MNRSKKRWIIGLSTTILMGVLAWVNINYLYIGYYYTFKFNHYNAGDKIYLPPNYLDDKSVDGYPSKRLIQPLTAAAIDSMTVSSQQKVALLKTINPNLKPYVKLFSLYFDYSKMRKNKTSYLGSFAGYKIVNVKDEKKDKYYPVLYYIIVPNKSILYEDDYMYTAAMPKGYMLSDGSFYIEPDKFASVESAHFE